MVGGATLVTVGQSVSLRAQGAKTPKVGFLWPGAEADATSRIAAFLEGLRWAGYRAPDEIQLVSRMTGGDRARLAPMAGEILRENVDVIVPVSPAAVHAVRSATSTTPIVAHDLETDPVASGLVASFARPGGNITGLFFDFPEFSKKWLELLKETVPQLAKVAVLWDSDTGTNQLTAVRQAAGTLHLELDVLELRTRAELEQVFLLASQRAVGAVLILSSPVIGTEPKLPAEIALRHRVPTITLFTEFARAGGLMGYGPNILDTFRQVGSMAGKVLQGRKPADLPVELPSRFEFVLNLKSARTLGLTIPTSILLRADEVIE